MRRDSGGVRIIEEKSRRPAADDLDDVVGHTRLGQRGCPSNAEGMGIDVASAREGGPQDFDDDLSREEVAVGEQKQRGGGIGMREEGEVPECRNWAKW